jgi:hypothetical protein
MLYWLSQLCGALYVFLWKNEDDCPESQAGSHNDDDLPNLCKDV